MPTHHLCVNLSIHSRALRHINSPQRKLAECSARVTSVSSSYASFNMAKRSRKVKWNRIYFDSNSDPNFNSNIQQKYKTETIETSEVSNGEQCSVENEEIGYQCTQCSVQLEIYKFGGHAAILNTINIKKIERSDEINIHMTK